MKHFFFGSTTNSAATDAGLLVLRVVAGLALALGHGLGKLPPSERFIEGVGGMGFPVPPLFAWAAAISEFFGGVFLALGFLTRPSSLFVGITMAVALLVRHAGDPFGTREKALLYLAIAVLFALAGAGRYSIDNFVNDRRRDR